MNKYSMAEKEQIVVVSGKSQRQFSLSKGINQHTLKDWAKNSNKTKKTCFVELSIKENELKASWGTKVIIRTKGIEIEVELESLAKVLEVVVHV